MVYRYENITHFSYTSNKQASIQSLYITLLWHMYELPGSSPVRLLFWMLRISNSGKVPISSGRGPLNWLNSKYSRSNCFSSPKDDGMAPWSLFPVNSKICKFNISLNAAGIVPTMSQWPPLKVFAVNNKRKKHGKWRFNKKLHYIICRTMNKIQQKNITCT